jgi:hypothetical protein
MYLPLARIDRRGSADHWRSGGAAPSPWGIELLQNRDNDGPQLI